MNYAKARRAEGARELQLPQLNGVEPGQTGGTENKLKKLSEGYIKTRTD